MTEYRKADAYWPPQWPPEEVTAGEIMAYAKKREQECEDLCAEIIKLKGELIRRETNLREMDREYLKLRAAMIRIANGTDLDPVETANKAIKGII